MRIELSDTQRENIRETRKKKNITADMLSESLGRSKNWFSQVERGRQKIDVDDLKRVAEELDCSVSDLIGYMPGEILESDEESNGTIKFNVYDLLQENMELKKENEVLKERLRQIKYISELV